MESEKVGMEENRDRFTDSYLETLVIFVPCGNAGTPPLLVSGGEVPSVRDFSREAEDSATFCAHSFFDRFWRDLSTWPGDLEYGPEEWAKAGGFYLGVSRIHGWEDKDYEFGFSAWESAPEESVRRMKEASRALGLLRPYVGEDGRIYFK